MYDASHKELFERYQDSNVIYKCEQYAKFTIASLMADVADAMGSGQQVPVERDHQEMGALLVNNLGSKLTSLLFPSSRPFFKASMSEALQAQTEAQGFSKTEVASALARIEMDACQQLFKNASYNQLVIAIKHLIVTGNVLLHRDSDGKKTTAYSLQHFGLRRDGKGKLTDCVLREQTYFEALDLSVQKALRKIDPSKYGPDALRRPDAVQVNLYTRIKRVRRGQSVGYEVSQQAETTPVGKPGYYPEHLCPWQAPTWNLIAGEHYARGMVEEYAGGFAKLSDLSRALTLYEIESTKVVNLVQPGSGADIDALAAAETGEYVAGDPASVQAYETGSEKKVQAVMADIEATFGRLARAFMYTANTRNAERVTAYELRQDALEAENTLGGIYSSLAEGLQVPMAHLLMVEVNPGTLAGIVTQDVKLDVMAGIPALGRSVDVQNLLAATSEIQAITAILAQVDRRVDMNKVNDLIYAGRSVDVALIMKSEAQLAEEAQADQDRAQGMASMQSAEAMATQQETLNSLAVQ